MHNLFAWKSQKTFEKVSPDLEPGDQGSEEEVHLHPGERLPQAPPLPVAEGDHLGVGSEDLSVLRQVPWNEKEVRREC